MQFNNAIHLNNSLEFNNSIVVNNNIQIIQQINISINQPKYIFVGHFKENKYHKKLINLILTL